MGKVYMQKYLVIIPTYNESTNINDIIKEVFIHARDFDIDILVVDDKSPDNTAQIVKNLIKNNYENKLFILEREGKLGLASAYISGFKWGMEKNYTAFIQMDADFSHHPKYLPDMLTEMNSHDVVIGSRYVKNGGIKGWGILRKLVSFGGSLYSRIILGIHVRDFTGGFNVWKKKVVGTIKFDEIISCGYSFQVELKYRAQKNGFKMLEYPIIFEDRIRGKSKMSKKIFFEAVINIWKIKFRLN
ncbi:MAG: polyprenol monophosphomannose synthase [Spirochaetes bacterium]|nr:polyprenol monophosphomannose synthase [Spirochaetota bacterium]